MNPSHARAAPPTAALPSAALPVEGGGAARPAGGPEAEPLLCPHPRESIPTDGRALYALLEVGGCPLAAPVQERLRFETLLADVSAAFVNVAADQVDSQITSALRRIVEFLGIDRSGLGESSPDGSQLIITHSYEVPGVPPSPRVILEAHFPSYAAKLREGEAFRIPDDLPPEAVVERAFLAKTGLKSNFTIPLKASGAVVGGIGFASFRSKLEWPEELVRRLRLVGDIFTNALARKRADEELRALASKLLTAQEEERRRVAREMHDDWTQRLAVMGLDFAQLEKRLGDAPAALPLLQAMQGRLTSLAEDVHALSRQLHPSILDDLGLAEALRSECAGFTRREGISVDYRVEGALPAAPKETALCIYRVAQEALRNLAKHAAVREAWVTLAAAGPELVLRVRDEGIGFEPASTREQPGLGLASMAERVRLARGRLSIVSAPGRGATVEVRCRVEASPPKRREP